jgi:signal transduction histidine kinase
MTSQVMAWQRAPGSRSLLVLGLSAWLVVALAGLALLVISVLRPPLGLSTLLPALFALSWMLGACLILWRRPQKPIAVSAAVFLTAFPLMFTETAARALPEWPLATSIVGFLGLASLQLFLYLFPDGRFAPRWTRWLWLASLAFFAVRSFSLGTPIELSARFPVLDDVAFVAFTLSAVAVQVHRYRRISTEVQREQTLVVVYGLSVAIIGALVVVALEQSGALGPAARAERFVTPALYALIMLIPASLSAAILRYRLWQIEPLVNRTLVHGTAALLLLGVYLVVVLGVTTLIRDSGWLPVSVVTVGLIALIFQPLHQRLQVMVNRLMYGERDDPYQVLARLGQRVRTGLEPEAVLVGIVETVAAALRLPYVAIELDGSGGVARGTSAGTPVSWPLEYGHQRIGSLLACPRRGESFGTADTRLLTDLASQAGVAVHAARLTRALQQARERLVVAREEERKRLRRDLHDQLGATLGALTVKAGSANSLMTTDPEAAQEIIHQIEQELKACVSEIRRLVYGLRPPVLDERGLVAAIEDCAEQHSPRLHVTVTVAPDGPLPPLPAAVELAAFRIAQEALTNAARHSCANTCRVGLAARTRPDGSRRLELEITDDGRGLAPTPGRGIGIASMRERAAELGGTCTIETAGARGVRVAAMLPLSPGAGDE